MTPECFAKLLLSLRPNGPFSFRECSDKLDAEATELALRVVIHYSSFGEDHELVEFCTRICHMYPRLRQLAQAAGRAKHALQEQWHVEEAKDDPEDRDDA